MFKKRSEKSSIHFLLYAVINSWVIVFLLSTIVTAYPTFSAGDAFQLFPWTRKESDNVNYGYKLVSKIISQANKNDSLVVDASIRVAGLPKWLEKVKTSYGSLKITFTNSKPSNVVHCSPQYESCPWLSELRISLDKENYSIKFPFPVPDGQNPYHKYDYFTIAVNDSVHLQFQGVEDSIFMGSLLNNKRRNEPDKWLMAKGAIMVRTSRLSPLKIHNIELNADQKSIISEYLGIQLSQLDYSKQDTCDYYGIDFIDTTITEQIIQVSNVTVTGSTLLNIDSTYTITWLTEGKDAVQSCSLYVNYDNKGIWVPLAKVNGSLERYSWTVPGNSGAQCVIKVKAIGYEGQNGVDESGIIPITEVSEFQLQAFAISNSAAQLKWNPQFLNTANATALVIAYSSSGPVTSYPVSNADTVHYNFTVNSDTIHNLLKNVKYYFSAFILTSSGSYISAGDLAQDSVLIIDKKPPANNFQLLATSDTSVVQLTWESILELPDDADSIGIFKCLFRYPVSYSDSAAEIVAKFPVAKTGTYIVRNLNAGQNYYFALMIRDSSGNWSEPSEYSRTRARLLSSESGSGMAAVTITPSDTQRVFDDSLLIWNTSEITFVDTIDRWGGPLHGFIIISSGYQFRNGDRISKPLWIQVPYSSSIKPEQARLVRLYSYDIYKGGWILSRDSVILDTINHTLSAQNSGNSLPFQFLIDTLAPVVKVTSKTTTPIRVNQLVQDTVLVIDNIKNFNTEFLAGPGNTEPWDFSRYISGIDTVNSPQSLKITFPPGLASSCSGLRAQLTVSDGVNDITFNMSKPVKREQGNCDNFTTKKLQWAPVVVSANLDKPNLKSVMAFSSGKEDWSYNTEEMRIVKWISGHPNASTSDWVEYSPAVDSLFKLQPGNLIWIKTKERISIDFGSATIPQFADTHTVTFKAQAWTDFSNPFPFDIHVGDILEASLIKSKVNSADSLEIYSWDEKENTYQTEPIYLADMPGLHKLTDTIKGSKPYSVYNPLKKEITLHIPPVCVPSSSLPKRQVALNKSAQTGKGWSIRIDSWGDKNQPLPSVYCGQKPGLTKEITYQQSPSFSQQRVAVYHNGAKASYGSIVTSQRSETGTYYELLLTNSSSSASIVRATVGVTFGIGNSSLIRWYDADKDEWLNGDDTIQKSLQAKQSKTVIVAIGNEQYFRDIGHIVRRHELALRAIYPNPFNRMFNVKFSLPNNTRRVTFNVFNLMGQLMWSKELADLHPGPSSLRMDKQLAAGVYMMQMRVEVEGAGSPKVITKAVMCVK